MGHALQPQPPPPPSAHTKEVQVEFVQCFHIHIIRRIGDGGRPHPPDRGHVNSFNYFDAIP